ncbi:MAG: hypothetical protein V7636_1030 [Actinomycetota bacterium]
MIARWNGRTHLATLVGAAVAIAAGTVPSFVAVAMARSQGLEAERLRAHSYAEDVLGRSRRTFEQIDVGIARLAGAADDDPCSIEALDLMREIDVSSSYIQAIGAVRDDTVLCSSLGRETANIDLGPVDMTTEDGMSVRLDVSFPFSPRDRFLVVERQGFAAIVHKGLPVDVTDPTDSIAVATFATSSGSILVERGHIDATWDTRRQRTFHADGRLVSVVHSPDFHIGSIASISDAGVDASTRRAAAVLLPIGITTGAAVAWALLRLARSQTAFPAILRSAFRRKEMSLVYQPIVALDSGAWVGAEVLLRWCRAGQDIRPDVFIPSVEATGMSRQLTRHVVDLLCRDAVGLFSGRPDFRLALNLTPSDLADPHLPGLLSNLASKLGGTPRNIVVEATERGLLRPEVVLPVLSELRRRGFRLSVDDFGTGYSSLSYLERFHLDELKIDKIFVDTIGRSRATSGVVHHIIEMAKSLELGIVAEGIESQEQADILRRAGVLYAQGYHFSRPLPQVAFLDELRSNTIDLAIRSGPASTEG